MVFAIRGWSLTNGTVTSGYFILQDRYLEEEFGIQSIEAGIWSCDLHIDGITPTITFSGEDAIRTKYISFGPNVVASVVFNLYYTLEPASISELIWEFVGKKR